MNGSQTTADDYRGVSFKSHWSYVVNDVD